jgi:arginyl-tRNA synthetase
MSTSFDSDTPSLKDQIHALLADRVRVLSTSGALPPGEPPIFVVEPPRNPAHGDFSANLPMVLARGAKRAPMVVAAQLMEGLELPSFVAGVEILPPGFINFRIKPAAVLDVLLEILQADAGYGQSNIHAGQSIQIEFVSANPTGPLHVGHGRGAAYGSALARLLRAVGCEVQTEYYVNDAGRQMDILALSVWLRYLEIFGTAPALPENAYRGAYILDIAAALRDQHGARFVPVEPLALPENAEPEARLDAAIAYCRAQLGEDQYAEIHGHACAAILSGIREDLAAFGVHFDRWYSERSLIGSGQLQDALDELRRRGFIETRDGAQWFASSRFGDEKDRVVVRENGAATYFATDIAYHTEKMARGFTGLINIWGADHHGYIPRVKAALSALGLDAERLQVLLVQFATLYRQGERVQMSTRSGEFVTLRELLEEVGPDAGRFFYLMRRSEQHLDFDLDLAKSQSQDNPVYYLQYAHARICSVLRQASQQQLGFDEARGLRERELLSEKKEHALVTLAGRFTQVVASAAREREPHQVANYLRELAMEFHGYYNAHKILVPEVALRDARLVLCTAVRIVLRNGLDLLGVTAPEEM